MERGFKKELSQFISGVKIVVVAKNIESGASLDKEKREMSFWV